MIRSAALPARAIARVFIAGSGYSGDQAARVRPASHVGQETPGTREARATFGRTPHNRVSLLIQVKRAAPCAHPARPLAEPPGAAAPLGAGHARHAPASAHRIPHSAALVHTKPQRTLDPESDSDWAMLAKHQTHSLDRRSVSAGPRAQIADPHPRRCAPRRFGLPRANRGPVRTLAQATLATHPLRPAASSAMCCRTSSMSPASTASQPVSTNHASRSLLASRSIRVTSAIA
jgi:hypothetical protein